MSLEEIKAIQEQKRRLLVRGFIAAWLVSVFTVAFGSILLAENFNQNELELILLVAILEAIILYKVWSSTDNCYRYLSKLLLKEV